MADIHDDFEDEIQEDISDVNVSDDETAETQPEEEKTYVYAKRIPYAYTRNDIQAQIATALGKKFNSVKNGQIVEKHITNASIYKAIFQHVQSRMSNEKFKQIYITIAYDVLNSSEKIQDIVEHLKTNQTIWNHPRHKTLFAMRDAEESDFTDEMEESIYECADCRRHNRVYNKTRSVSIQTRSGDEGMTLYISCMICRKVWKIYN